jgi:protease II
MRTPVTETGREHWEEVIPHREDVLLEGVELFAHHMVLVERADGLIRMRIRPWSGQPEHEFDFGEPAKLVARLRAHKTDSNRLLLRTQMEAGHGGVSGRYKRYRETAFIYAFLLDTLRTQDGAL